MLPLSCHMQNVQRPHGSAELPGTPSLPLFTWDKRGFPELSLQGRCFSLQSFKAIEYVPLKPAVCY